MAYEKLNLRNGQKLDEAHLAHMEDGIANAALVDHTHTAEDVGAAAADHSHTAADVGAAAADHSHTAADVGAAPAIEDATYKGCYYRMVDGVKEWINTPDVVTSDGVEYRTTKRYNGKIVYRKWYSCGGLPNSSTKTISTGYLGHICTMNLIAFNGTLLKDITAPAYINGALALYVEIRNGNVDIITKSDLSGYGESYLLVEYTKTYTL